MRKAARQAATWVSSSEKSIAGAEWVSAPIETKSTPVAAICRTLRRLTPPLASNFTFPFPIATASRIWVPAHVVEQDHLHARDFEQGADLIEVVGFHFDLQPGPFLADALDRALSRASPLRARR